MNLCCNLLSFSFEICMCDISNETSKIRYWDNPQIWDLRDRGVWLNPHLKYCPLHTHWHVTLVRIRHTGLILQLVARASFATLNPGLD